jgi:hypothetical protein
MRPPRSVQIGPYRYTVVLDQVALDRMNAEQGSIAAGRCDREGQRLLIQPKMGPDSLREVFFHEVLHALTELTGLDQELGEEADEKVVLRLAPMLIDTFQRNPSLVRYLTER